MPFFSKRKDSKDNGASSSTNGNGISQNGNSEKINYKARLEHKMYLVSFVLQSLPCGERKKVLLRHIDHLKSIFYKNILENQSVTQKICKACPVDFVQNQLGSRPCKNFCVRLIFKYVFIKNGL